MPGHLTMEEHDRIAHLRHQGANQKEIAQAVVRDKGTISRELRRNRTEEGYFAGQAQRKSEHRRRQRPIVRKPDHPEINQSVRVGLAQEWSPQQIVDRLGQQAVRDRPRGPF